MKTQKEIKETAIKESKIYADNEAHSDERLHFRNGFIKGYQAAQEEMKQHAIQFLESIRDYERENGDRICNDERSSEKLYDIFISKPLIP